MDPKKFAELLKKYQTGHASDKERKIIEQWFSLLDHNPRVLQSEEWDTLEKRLWDKLERKTSPTATKHPVKEPFFRQRIHIARAAALLFGFLCLGTVLFLLRPSSQGILSANTTTYLENNTNSEKRFMLTDGSEISLSPGSQLSFQEGFNITQRDVRLIGGAFFKITKNQQLPFLVNTGGITTKVLGTSFHIRPVREGSEIEVAVKTGKVSVYPNTGKDATNHPADSIVLTPNHQVRFTRENGQFVTGLVESPEMLPEAPTQIQAFNYRDTELSRILRELSSAYNILLELERPDLKNCPLTANLNGKDLYSQLNLICAAIQGSFRVDGTTILITGKDCE